MYVIAVSLFVLVLLYAAIPKSKKQPQEINVKKTIITSDQTNWSIPELDEDIIIVDKEVFDGNNVKLGYVESTMFHDIKKDKQERNIFYVILPFPVISNPNLASKEKLCKLVYSKLHGNMGAFSSVIAPKLYKKIKNYYQYSFDDLILHFKFKSSIDPWEPSKNSRVLPGYKEKEYLISIGKNGKIKSPLW